MLFIRKKAGKFGIGATSSSNVVGNEFVKREKRKNTGEQTRGNLIGFSSIHLLVPRFFDRWIPAAGIPRRKIRRDSAAAYRAPRVEDSGYSVGHAINWIESSNR